jgi:hypothetical protein
MVWSPVKSGLLLLDAKMHHQQGFPPDVLLKEVSTMSFRIVGHLVDVHPDHVWGMAFCHHLVSPYLASKMLAYHLPLVEKMDVKIVQIVLAPEDGGMRQSACPRCFQLEQHARG